MSKLYKILTVVIFLLISFNSNAINSTAPKISGGGNWTTSSSWAGTAPGCTVSSNSTYTIRTGDSIFTTCALSFSGSPQITVQSGAVLYIPFNVTISGSVQFDIESGGKVIITGNLNLGGSSELSTSGTGTLEIFGNVTQTGGGSQFDCSGIVKIQGTGCTVCDVGSGCTQSVPLPYPFQNFNFIKYGNNSILSWNYNNLDQNDIFYLEKSFDGVNFELIETFKVYNNLSENYTFVDGGFLNDSKVYYKLTQSNELLVVKSDIICIYNGFYFDIIPNPSEGKNISFIANDINSKSLNIAIINQIGATIFDKTVDGSYSKIYGDEIGFTLVPGMYYFILKTDNGVFSNKFIVF